MTRRDPSAIPWWSEPGAERCDFCLHMFQVEIGYHCVDCDRPVCPVCIVTLRERRAASCPECLEADEEPSAQPERDR